MRIQYQTTHIRLSLLLFVFLCKALNAQETKQNITLGLSVLPPFTEMVTENQCEGTYVAAVKDLIDESSAFNVTVICAPPVRIFRMIETGQVDLTINVKSTERLRSHVSFHPVLFSYLTLILYVHEHSPEKSIAAIRGFDYHGFRRKFTEQNYQFVDVPNGMDAVQLFLRKRSASLMLYEGTFEWYLAQHHDLDPEPISKSTLQLVPTYFAVSNVSEHKQAIEQWLDDVESATVKYQTLWQYLHSNS